MKNSAVAIMMIGLSSLTFGQESNTAPQAADPPASKTAVTPGVPLDRFIAFAELQHPSLAKARADIGVEQGLAVQAGLYPNPTFEGGYEQFGGNANQAPVVLSQRFVTAGKLTLAQEAASQKVYQAEQLYIQARFQVMTGVRRAFYAALAGQERIDVLNQLIELLSKSRDLAERRRKGGQGTRSDVVLLDIQLKQTQAQLRNAEAGLIGLTRELAASIGAQVDANMPRVEGDFDADINIEDYATLLAAVRATNAQARAADLEVVRSRVLLRRAEVEPIPDVTVTAGYQGNSGPPVAQTRLVVSMPIPLWNRNQGNRYAAAKAIHSAAANADTVRIRLGEQLANAWRRYQSATDQVKVILDEVVPATVEGIDLTRKGYEAGQLNLLSFLNAQQGLSQAYLSYVNTQEQRWLAAADIAGLMQLDVFPPIMPATPTPALPAGNIPDVPSVPPAP